MDQAELLAYLLDVLEGHALPYAIAGSHASMAFGEARLTNDIDVLVLLTPESLPAFVASFPPDDFYVSEDGARTAAAKGGMFNIIHPDSGQKIVVIVPAGEFDRSQLDRAVVVPVFSERQARFVSPEDTIIKKMDYYREGGSEKHLRDIVGVLRVTGARLEENYISLTASRLGLHDIWLAIKSRAGT